MSPPLGEEGSCEKIQTCMGKALLVVQRAEKFAPPKSAGHFPSSKDPPGIRGGTLAYLI
jgi:hypothetical protein